jgi:hypothetical protein
MCNESQHKCVGVELTNVIWFGSKASVLTQTVPQVGTYSYILRLLKWVVKLQEDMQRYKFLGL